MLQKLRLLHGTLNGAMANIVRCYQISMANLVMVIDEFKLYYFFLPSHYNQVYYSLVLSNVTFITLD